MLPAVFLMGPTASGKTACAMALVEAGVPVELISVDSALVFQDMDIGTAKPSAEELARAPHHLIDIISPESSYSAAQFRTDAQALIRTARQNGRIPVLVGGTMLYFNTLQHGIHDLPQASPALRAELLADAARLGWPALHARLATLDPATAARLAPNDAQRIERALEICLTSGQPMSALLARPMTGQLEGPLVKLALQPSDRAVLHQRIATRFDVMLAQGLIDEVAGLRQRYALDIDMTSMRCVGYRQTWDYLDGRISRQELVETGVAATRQLAKRQLTWLRGMDDVDSVDCLAPDLIDDVVSRVRALC
ncbi:tRNA (adenosine(37)-N6)-dimethylallyltransferase MiaA [Chitinibacteraceae bacterium HSL-7]